MDRFKGYTSTSKLLRQRDMLLKALGELKKASGMYYDSYSIKNDESGTVEGIRYAVRRDLEIALREAGNAIAECEKGE